MSLKERLAADLKTAMKEKNVHAMMKIVDLMKTTALVKTNAIVMIVDVKKNLLAQVSVVDALDVEAWTLIQ